MAPCNHRNCILLKSEFAKLGLDALNAAGVVLGRPGRPRERHKQAAQYAKSISTNLKGRESTYMGGRFTVRFAVKNDYAHILTNVPLLVRRRYSYAARLPRRHPVLVLRACMEVSAQAEP